MPPVNPILGPSEVGSDPLLTGQGNVTAAPPRPQQNDGVKKTEPIISVVILERHYEKTPGPFRKEIIPRKESGNTPHLLPLPHTDESLALVGAAVSEELLLGTGEIMRLSEEVSAQAGKILTGRPAESSLISSLGLLLNKAFSLSSPALANLMHTLSNHNLQLQTPAQGLASAETLLQQAPLQTKAGDIPLSTIKGFVESVAHQVSLALSMTVSHGAQLNPAQALTLALAKSLNLSAEQTSKLLGQIQSATAGQLSAATGEQARLVNPFIQGMVLNDPSAMKGFMAQLFSPVLKSLMGLLFTKELPFSYFPSNLLTELGGLMARSAQRKRNRPQRKRVGKSDRVSRKGSIYVEVDLEDEGFEPEEETDWWERFYNPEEAQAFSWN